MRNGPAVGLSAFSQTSRRAIVAAAAATQRGWRPLLCHARRRAAAPAFSDFLKSVETGKVTQVTFSDHTIDVVLSDGSVAQTVAPQEFLAANASFVTDLYRRNIRVDVIPAPVPGSLSWGATAIVAVFLALLTFTVYRTTSGRIPSISSRARVAEQGDHVITFKDVAGVDEAKDEVQEIVDFLREPGRFSAIGGRIPKGVLLVGPPGTGKTLLARSIAGEAGVPFLFASGSDFVEMYAGVGASRVRRLFRDAARHPSCIVFIDELDAVGRSRGGSSLSHEEREQTLNQLLVEMDGFEAHRGIVVIAATNRPDILDPALLRPGRLDRQVTVGNPDLKGREAILRVHTRKIAVDPGADLRIIARGTPGFSGADLANLVNEAALLAGRAGRTTVTDGDLNAARDKVLMGVERRSIVVERPGSQQLRLSRGGPRRRRSAPARRRPAAQGHYHPTRPGDGRHDAAPRGGSPHLHERLPGNAGRRADGRARRRRALHEPHDERRLERHRARHRHRPAHGVRVGHVRARSTRLPQGGQRVRRRSRRTRSAKRPRSASTRRSAA